MSEQDSTGWQAPQNPSPPPPPVAGGHDEAPSGAWQPPAPATPWDAQPGETRSTSIEELAVAHQAVPRRRSPVRIAAAVVAVGALIGASAFAIGSMQGSDDGGASSPEEAVRELVAAVNAEDVLGAMDVVLPGERRTFEDPVVRLVEELQRIDVLSDGADLGKVAGLDIEISLEEATVESVADDIATVAMTGSASVSVNSQQLPIGDLLLEEAFAGEQPEGSSTDESPFGGAAGEPVRITTVEQDGRWYVSLWYSVAEVARVAGGFEAVPAADQAIEPSGGASPEAAMDAFVDDLSRFDLEGMIGALNPDEASALQRYAPLFLGEAQAEIDDLMQNAGLELTIEDVEYDVNTDGDTATIVPTRFMARAAGDGQEATVELADGCTTVTMDGDEQQSCIEDATGVLEDLGLGALAGLGTTGGLTMDRVDGQWYLSILGTTFDTLLSVMEQIDRADIETFMQGLEDGSIDPFEAMAGIEAGTVDPLQTIDPAPGEEVTDSTPADDTATDDAGVDEAAADESATCYLEEDAAQALECLLAAQAVVDFVYIPGAIRFPECGIADRSWRYSWGDLDDKAFIDLVTEAHACFTAKVDSGELDEFDVPSEVQDPSCYEGVNPYALADFEQQSEALSVYLDCAYR
jgi:hypothetical protein